jgi:hypothetical protein
MSRRRNTTARTTARIAAQVNTFGRTEESAFLAYGWEQAEVDAAVAAGAIKRIGNRMGATTLRYLLPA